MTNEEFYTYPVAHETRLFVNKSLGISVTQRPDHEEPQFIALTVDQAKWLSHRLSLLADQILSGEVDGGDDE